MEIKLNSGDVITTPGGCKAVIKDKTITVIKEAQKFKEGDFCASNNYVENRVYIYKSNRTYYSSFCHAIIVVGSKRIEYKNWCDTLEGRTRLATEEEKQLLLDALHADGKDWDADNKLIIDYQWKPKVGESYYYIDCYLEVVDDHWSDDRFDNLVRNSGNCFKTKEEAQKYAYKFSEILKERKL